MLDRMKTLAIGASVFTLVGLGAAGGHGVFAATSKTPTASVSASSISTNQAYQIFATKLAANLGVTDPDKIKAAIKTSLTQMVDDQLATGAISTKDATALKKKIDKADQPGTLLGLKEFEVKPAKIDGGNATGNGADNHGGNSAPDDNGGNATANGSDNHGGNAGPDGNGGNGSGNASEDGGNATGNGSDNHGGNSAPDDNGNDAAGNASDNHGGNTSPDDNGNSSANGSAGADDNGGNATGSGDGNSAGNATGNATGDDHGGNSSGGGNESGGNDGNGGGSGKGGDS